MAIKKSQAKASAPPKRKRTTDENAAVPAQNDGHPPAIDQESDPVRERDGIPRQPVAIARFLTFDLIRNVTRWRDDAVILGSDARHEPAIPQGARELVDARHDAGRRWPETEI